MTDEIKFNSKSKNIRMEGEEGSPQNQLRYELYKEGFERIEKGLKEERYFEVVCICDSIINDRLTSLIQTMKNDEGIDFSYQSVGSIIRTLFKTVKETELKLDKDFKQLLIDVEHQWLPKRNFVSHSFVGVTNSSITMDLEKRLSIVKECGVEGSEYCRQITKQTQSLIRNLKKQSQ